MTIVSRQGRQILLRNFKINSIQFIPIRGGRFVAAIHHFVNTVGLFLAISISPLSPPLNPTLPVIVVGCALYRPVPCDFLKNRIVTISTLCCTLVISCRVCGVRRWRSSPIESVRPPCRAIPWSGGPPFQTHTN